MRVLLTWQASVDEIESLRSRVPSDVEVVAVPRRSNLSRFDAELADVISLGRTAQVFCGWVMPRDAIVEAVDLRFISYCSDGVDHLPLDTIRARKIQLANGKGVYARAVAEHAFALLLASAKRLIADHQAAVEVRWQPKRELPMSVELDGKTVAVLGLGAIGGQVARYAKAFGMHVLGISRSGSQQDSPADEIFNIGSLHEVLSRSDFVVLALPLTHETRRLMDEDAFRAMRPDAHLINVARGELVDESAVFGALTENRIATFATDCWWDYDDVVPSGRYFALPSRLAVHRLPNVIATGDRASNVPEGVARTIAWATDNVVAFVHGKQPRHLVDLNQGY